MEVSELLARIMAAYPGATDEAMKTFVPVFHARLRAFEGDALDAAAIAVLGSFKPRYDQKFPIPADFEEHLPKRHPDMKKDGGPKLDFKAHGDRVRSILAEWWAAQGKRAAGDNPNIKLALLQMAEPLANVYGWSADPAPLRLTVKQVRIVQQRAISQERVVRCGPLPRDAGLWWDQIQQIATEWGIQVRWEDWGRMKQAEAA